MYSNEILERFKNPINAGGMRGANGTGKAGDVEGGDIVKIYISVNDNEIIENAKFKAYGGVLTIVGSDIACEMIEGGSIENAMKVTNKSIMEKLDTVPQNKDYIGSLIEEAIKNAIEDYYKKKEKEEKK